MAKDSTKQPTPTTPVPPAKPSYQGGDVPKTFDPKDLGTKFFSDMERVYGQGPKVNPISSFVDYSGETKNLIGQGINNSAAAARELGGVATGGVGSSNPFYLSGPDYSGGFVDDLAGGRVDLGNDYKSGNIGAIGAGGPVGNTYRGGNLDAIAAGGPTGNTYKTGRIADIAGGASVGNDYKTGVVGDAAAGRLLGTGNPFLEAELQKTRDNIATDVNATFASNGRFGSDIHASGLSEGLADAENTARFNQYNTDYARMIEALGLQDTAAGRDVDRQVQAMGLQDQAAGRDLDRQFQTLGRQDDAAMRDLASQLQVLGYQDQAAGRDVAGRLQGLDMQAGQAADRRGQFETEYGRKLDAMDRIDAGTATGLGYAGLLDSKMRERNLADQEAWSNANDPDFNHLAKYLGLLRGGDSANETNKPLSIWDIIGGVGSTVGSFL